MSNALFLGRLVSGLLAGLLATAAHGQISPQAFLEDAKKNLEGDFLLWPGSMKALQAFNWESKVEFNRLDSRGRLKSSSHSALIRFNASSGLAEQRIYRKGKLQMTRQMSFGSLHPMAQSVSREMRDEIWNSVRFEFVAEEILDGRQNLAFQFRTTRPAKKERPFALRSANSHGKAWFDKSDRVLVKVEGEYHADVVLSKGFLVGSSVIPRGSRWRWQLRRMGDGTWLPAFHEESRKGSKFPWGSEFEQVVRRYREFARQPAR